MQPNEENKAGSLPELVQAGEAILERAKQVSQKSAEQVRKALDDTEPHCALPSDPTDEKPSIE